VATLFASKLIMQNQSHCNHVFTGSSRR